MIFLGCVVNRLGRVKQNAGPPYCFDVLHVNLHVRRLAGIFRSNRLDHFVNKLIDLLRRAANVLRRLHHSHRGRVLDSVADCCLERFHGWSSAI